MKKFSRHWKSSKNPRKQRNYRSNSPLNTKHKFLHTHLSKELRKRYGKRSTSIRKGDTVKVLRGQFSKFEGKVERISLKQGMIFVSGLEITKKDGSKRALGLNPSKVMITELNIDDKLRQEALQIK